MCMCMHMCTHALVRAHEMHAGTQESPVHAHVPRARDMPRGARASLCQARAPAHPLRRSQAIFRELDIDRSGKLSYAEMRTCMRPEVRGAESRTEGAAAADDGGGARPRRATIMIDARMPKLPRELEHRARDILSLHAQVRPECAAPPHMPAVPVYPRPHARGQSYTMAHAVACAVRFPLVFYCTWRFPWGLELTTPPPPFQPPPSKQFEQRDKQRARDPHAPSMRVESFEECLRLYYPRCAS